MNCFIKKLASLLLIALTVPALSSEQATQQVDSIVVGAGCFWGVEKRFAQLPGVIDVVSGYADGRGLQPSYRVITQPRHRHNPDNYAEVVQIRFNRQLISSQTLLEEYFEQHDPTQLNRQGNDIGTQYRSTILYNSEEQRSAAIDVRDRYQQLLNQAGYGDIVTAIKPLDKFHPAEEYHQDYLRKNPNGYCPDHSTGVTFKAGEPIAPVDNQPLQRGQAIVVLEAEDYCPYCEKFRADVSDHYAGSIPLYYRTPKQLDGLEIVTPTWATPTLLFLEEGREQFGAQGYRSAKAFYQLLGAFKLGDGEAFRVAFENGTDARFCRQYDLFKNTPDGVFVDALSGAALFDTRDRFNSTSGWLSFTQPVAGAVYEKADNSYGMQRTEIRSVSSDIHLGHVFDDGPGGLPRYCINATVLEFKAR